MTWLTYFVFHRRQFRGRFLFGFDKSVFGFLQLRLLLIQTTLVLCHCRFMLTKTRLNTHGVHRYHSVGMWGSVPNGGKPVGKYPYM